MLCGVSGEIAACSASQSSKVEAARWRPAPYQNLEQLLQVAGDEGAVFVKRPAALLRIIPVTGEVAEYDLQPLFVVTHLPLRQRRTQILQRSQTICEC